MQLIKQSKSLVPVYLRTNRLKSPLKAIMLCDYQTSKFKFSAGEQIILADNMIKSNVCCKYKYPHQNQPLKSYYIDKNKLRIIDKDAECDHLQSQSQTEEILDITSDSVSLSEEGVEMNKKYLNFSDWNSIKQKNPNSSSSEVDSLTDSLTSNDCNITPLGQSKSRLYWHIQSLNGKVEGLVPSVCVWIPSPDLEAQEKAIK